MKLLLTILALGFMACASEEPVRQAEVVTPPPAPVIQQDEKVETIVKDEKLQSEEIKEITKPSKKGKKPLKKKAKKPVDKKA